MEDHPRTGNCQDHAKIMTGSYKIMARNYLPRFKEVLT